ncbi:hypothetical protein IBZ16_16260 [Serratia marcescens]|uniref:hypothetical protein n=1 Tax=Serratia marcescens TaxID=615 RepID=UPI0039B3FB5F
MRLYKFVKPLQAFILTGSEVALANKCNLLGAKSWKSNASELNTFIRGDIKAREALKKKIKTTLKGYQENHCFYCGIHFSLLKNENSNVHIDHFYPKGAEHGNYEKFVFEMNNLVLSCCLCNGLGIKGENDYGINNDESILRIGSTIIHPYFDNIDEHFFLNENTGVIEFINIDKSKAIKTEEVFRLNSPAQIRARLGDILVELHTENDSGRSLSERITDSIGLCGRVALN